MMFVPRFYVRITIGTQGEIGRATNIRFYSTHCIALEVAAATVKATVTTTAAAAATTTTPQRGNDQIK